jgi:hypothetical protein
MLRTVCLFVVVLPAALSACAHHATFHGTVASPGRVPADERLAAREEWSPQLPDQTAVLPPACPGADGGLYRSLTERECQCLAAANAAVPALLQMENWLSAAADSRCLCTQGEAGSLQRRLRRLREFQLRNEAAKEALLRYYDLAEAEAARYAACRSLDVIDRTIQDVEQLAEQGVLLNGTVEELRRRQLEVQQQLADLVVTIDGLNRAIYYRLGLGDRQPYALWPDLGLELHPQAPPLEDVLATGMTMRAELNILRIMRAELIDENLPIARGILQQADPSLGITPGKQSHLCKLLGLHEDDELAIRDGQLLRLLREREEQISAEIQAQLTALEVRAQQVLLASTQVDNAKRVLDDLIELRRVGRGMPLDISQAELRVFQQEHELMNRFLAWKRAQVELAASLGVLAAECGFDVTKIGCCCQ